MRRGLFSMKVMGFEKDVELEKVEYGNEVAISVGVGFKKDARASDIVKAILDALKEVGCEVNNVRTISTVEGKEKSEIVKVAEILKKPLVFVEKDKLNLLDVKKTKAMRIGAKNVAEGCAILTSKEGKLILLKRVYGGVTVAVAR